MKINKILKISLIPLLIFGLISFKILPSNDKVVSIEELIKSNAINVKIEGTGGHTENCIKLDIKNLTNRPLNILIEPGRRLVSEDDTEQDILIVKRKIIKIPASSRKVENAYGFCCQSNLSSPGWMSPFSHGTMAPKSWIKLANLINKNSFPVSSIQSAIWVLSDNHNISSINAPNLSSIYSLRKTVADIKGVELPWYTFEYAKDPERVFSNSPSKVYGQIKYKVKNNSVVSVKVISKKSKLMRTIIKGTALGPGNYRYDMDLNVLNWPKGEYDVIIYEDFSNVIIKQKFII